MSKKNSNDPAQLRSKAEMQFALMSSKGWDFAIGRGTSA